MFLNLYQDPLVKDTRCRVLAGMIRLKAERQPDRQVLLFTNQGEDDIPLTYADLEDQSNRYAHALLNRGVQKGDTVGLIADNIPESLFLIIACSKVGAVFLPLDPKGVKLPSKLRFQLSHTKCSALFVAAEHYHEFHRVRSEYGVDIPSLKDIFVIPNGPDDIVELLGAHDTRSWTSTPADDIEIVSVKEQDPLTVFYTSGTTGFPKAVLWNNARYTSFGTFPGFLGYRPSDPDYRIYTGLPLYHSNAHGITVMYALWNGFVAVINRRWSLSNLWHLTRQYNIRSFCTIGNMALEIHRRFAHEEYVPNPVEHIVDGGLPGYLWEEFSKKFGIMIWEAYSQVDGGVTMTNPPSMLNARHVQRTGSIGKTGFGWETEVIGKDDSPCQTARFDAKGKLINPDEAIGEIVSRRKNSVAPPVRYLNDEEASKRKTRKGWHRSGDFGYKDADGFFYITHREGEAIRRTGKFLDVYDLDYIQKVILSHPGVYMAHIFPVESTSGVSTEKDMAVAIVPQHGVVLDIPELVDHCKCKLPSSLYHPNWLLVLDRIPMTFTRKPQNNALRVMFKERPDCVHAF